MLSLGRDLYCDTRLILSELESRFPNSTLAATSPADRAVEQLIEIWCVDGGIFARAAQLLPSEMPLINDEKFKKDREDFTGRSWSKENLVMARPEALVAIRAAFTFLEESLLGDGREWVLGSKGPMLADIKGLWLGLLGSFLLKKYSDLAFPLAYRH